MCLFVFNSQSLALNNQSQCVEEEVHHIPTITTEMSMRCHRATSCSEGDKSWASRQENKGLGDVPKVQFLVGPRTALPSSKAKSVQKQNKLR